MIVTTRTAGPRFGMPLSDEAARPRKGVEDMSYPDITVAVLRKTWSIGATLVRGVALVKRDK